MASILRVYVSIIIIMFLVKLAICLLKQISLLNSYSTVFLTDQHEIVEHCRWVQHLHMAEEGMMPKHLLSLGSRYAPVLLYAVSVQVLVAQFFPDLCILVLQIGDYLSVAIL